MNLAMSAWNSANGLRNVNAYGDDMRSIGVRVSNIQSWGYGYDTATLSETPDYDRSIF